MADGEPERLHPMEVLDGPRLDTQSDQLVQPRHQLAGPVLAESENLRWLGIDRGRELQCIEPVLQEADVLPEHLVDHVVGVRVDRRDRDVALRLRPAESVRSQHDRVTNLDRLLPELAEQDR